jgi:hypothetical protein
MKIVVASALLLLAAALWSAKTRDELKKTRADRDSWKQMYCGLAASESIRNHESAEYWDRHEGKFCKQGEAD